MKITYTVLFWTLESFPIETKTQEAQSCPLHSRVAWGQTLDSVASYAEQKQHGQQAGHSHQPTGRRSQTQAEQVQEPVSGHIWDSSWVSTGTDEERKLRNTSPFGRRSLGWLLMRVRAPLACKSCYLWCSRGSIWYSWGCHLSTHTFLVLAHLMQLPYPLSSDKSECFRQT